MKTMAVSTGLSHFHKMIVTVMRSTFPKAKPKSIKYRDFSKYSKLGFGNDLGTFLENQPKNYDTFEKIYSDVIENSSIFTDSYLIDISTDCTDEKFSCIKMNLLIKKTNIFLFMTHLNVHDNSDIARSKQLEIIFDEIKKVESDNVILLGDLNLLYKVC